MSAMLSANSVNRQLGEGKRYAEVEGVEGVERVEEGGEGRQPRKGRIFQAPSLALTRCETSPMSARP
jgi:hypothetical protein